MPSEISNSPRQRGGPAVAHASRPHGEGGFVIFSPSYVTNSAGIGCLYRLCHELRMLGF